MTTIIVDSGKYEGDDDCLTAAREDVAEAHGLELWEVDAEWGDDRETIIITVPGDDA